MGKLDLDAADVLGYLVASVKTNRRRIRESERGHDWFGVENATAAHASVLAVLQLAVRKRDARENETAEEIVNTGEARMALFLREPSWWDTLDRCCTAQYQDHILYGNDDGEGEYLLCPVGRGYWQLARRLLGEMPLTLRGIARRSARHIAPRWTHWTCPPTPERNFHTACNGKNG